MSRRIGNGHIDDTVLAQVNETIRDAHDGTTPRQYLGPYGSVHLEDDAQVIFFVVHDITFVFV